MGNTGKPQEFKLHDDPPEGAEPPTTGEGEQDPSAAQAGDQPQEDSPDGNAPASESSATGPETVEQITADRDKWKAMARKHEDRAKQNAAAAQEWAKHQEAAKSTAEDADQATQELTQQRDTALAELAVLRAAVKHNLSEDDLELLEGLPADVVEQRAEKLAARVHPRSPRTPDPHLGRETPPSQQKPGGFLSNAFKRR